MLKPPNRKSRRSVGRRVDDKVCDDVWDEVWELDVIPDRLWELSEHAATRRGRSSRNVLRMDTNGKPFW